MDNLTHSLTGAILGQMGLKKKTGLGMATLIIAANIPDVDAIAVLLGGHQHLAIRRGITHGPIAMLVLPLALTALMVRFDGWQAKRGQKRWARPADRLPIRKGWLFALALIGTLSHPAMDWLNSYGIRFLEPFSSQWFYGDSIFIIDIWIWVILIAGVLISRRREKKSAVHWQRPARVGFSMVCAYILANILITGNAEAETVRVTKEKYRIKPEIVVANPVPIAFWRRDVLWKYDDNYFHGNFSLFGDLTQEYPMNKIGTAVSNQSAAPLKERSLDLAAFLFWSRMPFVKSEYISDQAYLTFYDARFAHKLVADRFAVRVKVKRGEFDFFSDLAVDTCEVECAVDK
ncbi:Membrane-bound metal-dependent hydrolase [hydrothermal vent metagenome]|uniref:Membrane-bound metal-dependent hydrolase n=1 Tax=hydrothermal vent metagenome TaxID=652676 RepID=A0A3B0SPC5_9ZZZZ